MSANVEKSLTKTIGLPANLTESINMGEVFFKSGLFSDLKSAAQAVVKIQAGAEIGIPAFAALTGIHIIQGKPVIGAGLIASRIKGSGKYDYKIIEQSDKASSIDFYQGKEKIGNSIFTIEDARKAGTKNLDRFPKNMLFARAISNGVKWFCPDVFAGPVYTPEDFDVVPVDDVKHAVINVTTEDTVVYEAQPSIMIEDKQNPFKRKYDSATQISKALKDSREIKEVASLYYVNAEMIEATQELKAEFTTRKNELYSSQLPNNVVADAEAEDNAKIEINLVLGSISTQTSTANLEAYRKGLPQHVKNNPSVFAACAAKKKELDHA